MMRSPAVLVFITGFVLVLDKACQAFVIPFSTTTPSLSHGVGYPWSSSTQRRILVAAAKNAYNDEDDDDDDWDSDVDYDAVFPDDDDNDDRTQARVPDPSVAWESSVPLTLDNSLLNPLTGLPKLGIDIGGQLDPLTPQQAAELKAAATEIVNDAVAAGVDEIEALRKQMREEIEQRKAQMQRESDQQAEVATRRLLNKIDAISDRFLQNATALRQSTKLAAQADRAMEGRGVEIGSWGSLGGANVLMDEPASLPTASRGLGWASMDRADADFSTSTSTPPPTSNRLLIIADPSNDVYAKKLVEPLGEKLAQVLQGNSDDGLETQVVRPTESWPMGGNGAAAVLIFLTSLRDPSTLKAGLARIQKQVLGRGSIVPPPSQWIAVSTVGTARTNQMPYSWQNMMQGGKLDKRRQMEELFVGAAQQSTRRVDWTLCKLGDVEKNAAKEALQLQPGDVVDGALDPDTAATVLQQAVALQPAARNTTLSCVGAAKTSTQDVWDDVFVTLDGPELWRRTTFTKEEGMLDKFVSLTEYLREWAQLEDTAKGLTTPVRVVTKAAPLSPQPYGVSQQASVQLLFLPTATGARYLSRDEEKARQRERDNYTPSSTSSGNPKLTTRKQTNEGGVEVLVEVAKDVTQPTMASILRVRVRRCNYDNGVVIKEITEGTILSRVQKAVEVWQRDRSS